MNAKDLKLRLDNKDDNICANSDIGYVSLPLYVLSQKLLNQIGTFLDKKYTLSNSEVDVMASLYSAQETDNTLTPTKLYERLFFSSGGMTKVLKKLEQKGLIKRIDNKDDKRSKLVQLTQSGKEILKTSLADVIELEESIFSNLNEAEKQLLSDLLFKSLDGVD